MKGVILAGDTGTSLHPLTIGIPKQLLPLYDKPMIYYPIETLVSIGIKDILIITSPKHEEIFKMALGEGSTFGASFSYKTQESPEGVAQALTIGEEFIGMDPVCLTTGDCIIIGKDLPKRLETAIRAAKKSGNASVFVCSDRDPRQYGIVRRNKDGKCESLSDKPTQESYYSITGIYFFPKGVAEYAKEIKRSERGRFEVTDIDKMYHALGKLQIHLLGNDFKWFDTNTIDNIHKLSHYLAETNKQ